MTTSHPRNKRPRGKLEFDGDIPQWQLVIGGLFIAVVGMFAGIVIAETVLSIWLPELTR